MSAPKFSVVVPVYNKEKFIKRAINSVLSQTYDDFELIVVCDKSTDNSEEVVLSFVDERITLYKRDEVGPGGYAARNLGISRARGEWVTFLDADDAWTREHLSELVKLQRAYPGVKVLSCAKKIEFEGRVWLDDFSSSQSLDNYVFTFLDYLVFSYKVGKPFNTNTVAIEKSFIENLGNLFPDKRTKRSGDLYAWVKVVFFARNFAWSSHVGSYTFKDIVGVSQKNVPNPYIFKDLVNELGPGCNDSELHWLKRYCNKLIKTAWFEGKRKKVNQKSLVGLLYWEADFLFCLKWSLVSFLPKFIISLLTKSKKLLKQ